MWCVSLCVCACVCTCDQVCYYSHKITRILGSSILPRSSDNDAVVEEQLESGVKLTSAKCKWN